MSDTVDVTVKLPKPPEGMEWKQDAPVDWSDNRNRFAGESIGITWALRPIVSATVMVEMPRDIVEGMVDSAKEIELDRSPGDRMIAAFRAALARKPYPQFDPAKHVDPTLAPDEIKVDGTVYKLRKPCPVMVCRLSADNRWKQCFVELRRHHDYRRPCKLEAGHGGEHE